MTDSHIWFGTSGLGAAGSGGPTVHDVAMRMLAFNKARIAAFAPRGIVVNDVAWELMLTMFVAQERGRRLSLHRLCDDVPMARMVSIRWLRALRAGGLVEYDDRNDGVAEQVRLTAAAVQAMRELMEV